MSQGFASGAKRPGRLVALIGLDGAGKTSQVAMLGKWMASRGVAGFGHASVTLAPVRRALDKIANEDGKHGHLELIGGETMRLISACSQLARVDAIGKVVATTEGIHILDRYTYCQYALAKAEGVGDIPFLRRLFAGAPQPDLVMFLDVTPEEAFRRINVRGTDSESLEFLTAFRDAYCSLPERPDFVTIPGDGNFDDIQSNIRSAIERRFPEYFEASDD